MLKISCIQMNSSANMSENVAKLQKMVAEAAGQGAKLVATPENSFLMDEPKSQRELYTMSEHPVVRVSADMARENKVFLLIGSVAVADDGWQATDDNKAYNRSILFNPNGEIIAHYDKIHLFDVEVGDGQVYRESTKIMAGNRAVVAKTQFFDLGMTVCYDLRFPHLFRALAKNGANIIATPAAFTKTTGEAHWHVLQRARAIETGCFIIAPAQTGTHAGGRQTFGHSLIIDPWGMVLADGGEGEGIVAAEIDLAEVEKTRAKMPSLRHDREFSVA